MTHLGSPSEWVDLLDSQVPDILALVIDTWERIPAPAANDLENTITNRLCAALQNHPERTRYLFHIQPQAVILEPDLGTELGRMDIAFLPFVPSDEIYFCLECKRLHVLLGAEGVRSYYSEYVRFGMLRFVTGQYSHAVHHGGMLAYVLDGDVGEAVAGIKANIQALHQELGMAPPGAFDSSSVRPADTAARETKHRRTSNPDQFLIHHLFVAGEPNAAMRIDYSSEPKPPPLGKKTPVKTRRKTRK